MLNITLKKDFRCNQSLHKDLLKLKSVLNDTIRIINQYQKDCLILLI